MERLFGIGSTLRHTNAFDIIVDEHRGLKHFGIYSQLYYIISNEYRMGGNILTHCRGFLWYRSNKRSLGSSKIPFLQPPGSVEKYWGCYTYSKQTVLEPHSIQPHGLHQHSR
jgi:hypothetical protein